ncbi:tryptophan synthase subunit alpha [Candidatus Vidania fulgoroideorum]
MNKVVFSCIPFFPSKKKFFKKIHLLKKIGFDSLEICFPNDSSIMDGKNMLNAYKISINNGFNIKKNKEIKKIFNYVIKLKFNNIFLMFDSNYILNKKFVYLLKRKKYKNFLYILPDIDIKDRFYINNKKKVFLLTNLKNFRKCKNKNMFYLIRSNMTGKKINSNTFLKEYRKIKNTSNIIVGFGISDFNTILKLHNYFDYIVIGTKIISFFLKNNSFFLFKNYIENVKNKINKNRK